MNYKLASCMFMLLSMLLANAYGNAVANITDDDDETKILITSGHNNFRPMPIQWTYFKSDEALKSSVQDEKYLFHIDHEKLYLIDKKTLKVIHTKPINTDKTDWIYSIGVKNNILVLFAFSYKNQEIKVERYHYNKYKFSLIEWFQFDFSTKEGARKFVMLNAPRIINNKIAFEFTPYEGVKKVTILRKLENSQATKQLKEEISLINILGQTYDSVLFFIDAFQEKSNYRYQTFNTGIGLNKGTAENIFGVRDGDTSSISTIVEIGDVSEEYFGEKFFSYINYLTNGVYNELSEREGELYLATLNLETEFLEYKKIINTPCFDTDDYETFVSSTGKFYSVNHSQIQKNSKSYINYRICDVFFTENTSKTTWKTSKFPNAWPNTYFFESDIYFYSAREDLQANEDISTKVYIASEEERKPNIIDLQHSTESIFNCDNYVFISGMDRNDIYTISMLDISGDSLLGQEKVKGLFDIPMTSCISMSITKNKVLLGLDLYTSEYVVQDGLEFDVKDESDYSVAHLVFFLIEKNTIEHIAEVSYRITNQKHCKLYCDYTEFDNRTIIQDQNNLFIVKGSIISKITISDELEFNFEDIDLSEKDENNEKQ